MLCKSACIGFLASLNENLFIVTNLSSMDPKLELTTRTGEVAIEGQRMIQYKGNRGERASGLGELDHDTRKG